MNHNNLDHYKDAFKKIGWFIPPYVSMGILSEIANEIYRNEQITPDDLGVFLERIYSEWSLAPMVTERYSKISYIKDYQSIINEAIQAHFLKLDHIAVTGLLPVIEGAGRKIAQARGVKFFQNGKTLSTKRIFIALANNALSHVQQNNIGAVGEIIAMLESFKDFIESHLFTDSLSYTLSDKTNRHGILHGEYSDEDFGKPINFYKTISAINFLCFIVSFEESHSFLAPNQSEASQKLAGIYLLYRNLPTIKHGSIE